MARRGKRSGSPKATMSGFLQTLSEEGAQSVAGYMSNPVSKKFVEVGINNSTPTQSRVLTLPTRGLPRASSYSTKHSPSLERRQIAASLVALSTNLLLADRKLEGTFRPYLQRVIKTPCMSLGAHGRCHLVLDKCTPHTRQYSDNLHIFIR